MDNNKNSNKLGLMIATYVIIFVVGGVCGYFLNGALKTSSSVSNNGMNQFNQSGSGNSGFSGRFGGGSADGGFSRGGRVSGEVTAVNGNTITVKNSFSGQSETVTVGDSTTYKQTDDSSLSKVTVGSTINASGTANSDGSVSASTVTVQ